MNWICLLVFFIFVFLVNFHKLGVLGFCGCENGGSQSLGRKNGSYEQLRAVTSSYEQLRAVTSSYKQLQAVTSTYEPVYYMYMYIIYIRHRASGTQSVYDPMVNLQNAEEGSRRFFSFNGKQVPGAFSLRSPFWVFFRLFFTPPFLCAFAPKHSQNGRPKNVKNLKNHQKITH